MRRWFPVNYFKRHCADIYNASLSRNTAFTALNPNSPINYWWYSFCGETDCITNNSVTQVLIEFLLKQQTKRSEPADTEERISGSLNIINLSFILIDFRFFAFAFSFRVPLAEEGEYEVITTRKVWLYVYVCFMVRPSVYGLWGNHSSEKSKLHIREMFYSRKPQTNSCYLPGWGVELFGETSKLNFRSIPWV